MGACAQAVERAMIEALTILQSAATAASDLMLCIGAVAFLCLVFTDGGL